MRRVAACRNSLGSALRLGSALQVCEVLAGRRLPLGVAGVGFYAKCKIEERGAVWNVACSPGISGDTQATAAPAATLPDI